MIKNKTILYGISPEMCIIHSVVVSIFERHGYGWAITSAVGRKHMDKSLHPVGFAIDYRSKHLPNTSVKQQLFQELKQALPCCDLLLEDLDGEQEHYHIEFDPKYDDKFQQDKQTYKETGRWPE